MLGAGRRLRFSKTARSCPCHRETGWDGKRGRVESIFNRRFMNDFVKCPAECPETCEADVEADVSDAAVGFAQQEHRSLDTAPLKVAVRRLIEGGSEGSDEMRLGDAGKAGQSRDVERISVSAVHRITGAKHPAIDFLQCPGHLNITRYATTSRRGAGSRILVRLAGIEPAAFRSGAERSVR